MTSPPRRPHRSLVAWLVLALTLPAGAPAAVAETPDASGPATAGPATPEVVTGSPGVARVGEPTTVTLITGDRVDLVRDAKGRWAAGVTPAPREDGTSPAFETLDHDGDLYVVPSDVTPLLGSVLDLELFNVTKLAAYGYTDGTRVIVATPGGSGPAAMALTAEGVSATRYLPSIDATAATITPDGRWWRTTFGASRHGARPSAAAAGGVARVWLDEVARITLDESVPLVGAPQAWGAGYDGTGVTVAVLDTGVDTGHPDLAGKVLEALNFTSEDTEADENGHGTHVAGTIAGSGAASGGAYKGVAPGADLVSGKVCDRFGNCLTSWIIAGMEWAAERADVVNMSLGTTTGSDGTDPVSQAVNALSVQHDVLFVVAAGNSGVLGDGSVGSPGAADAALTVGSVDKQEQLSGTSSRGPRLGDFAIKPDITAPGVDIVAPRAAGTSLGTPVDEHYTRLSGTSMATPHVAGAAAILRQAYPALPAPEVKAALVTSAVPNDDLEIYQQGGGRLDVATAVLGPVRAFPASHSLGLFEFPHDEADSVTAQVAYTNRGQEPLELDLSLAVRRRGGGPPPPQMLSVDPQSLTVPPGATASATLTLDVRHGEEGLYGGYLVATSDGQPVARTPVGFLKQGQRFDLTVRAIDAHGAPATGSVTVVNVDDPAEFFELSLSYDANGEIRMRVPEGRYSIHGWVNTGTSVHTAAAEPELFVDDDTEVVFDTRAAVPITVEAPAHDVALVDRMGFALFREAADGFRTSRTFDVPVAGRLFRALPTGEVSVGAFEFSSRWQLADPVDPVGSTVRYDVVFPEIGSIPESLHYVVYPEQLGTSHQRFHTHVPRGQHLTSELRHWWRPWQVSSLAISVDVAAPGERVEYLATDDTGWTRVLLYASPGFPSSAFRMNAPEIHYQPGEIEHRDWMKQAVTPGMVEGSPWHPTIPQVRTGDTLELFIAEFSDSQPGHWGFLQGRFDEASFRLYQDGELIAEQERPRGTFALSPEPSRLRLETEISRDVFWWRYSTRTFTAWEFDTQRQPEGVTQAVPFLLVDYDIDLDLLNVSPHPRGRGGANTIRAWVRHQPGADQVPITHASLWVSYDDGDTWVARPAIARGGGIFEFPLDQRDPAETNGFVSLRFEATDADGNRIEQEITRAYALTLR